MDVVELFRTIYLGDRACKAVIIDGWSSEVMIQVDCISRVRSATWDYYTDEDMEDGFLVFERVSGFRLEPAGLVPNDFINSWEVRRLEHRPGAFEFKLSIHHSSEQNGQHELFLTVVAEGFALEHKASRGVRIRE